MPKPKKLKDLIYVCAISNYNLPEFESCLLHRPKYVVLIVSKESPFQQAAKLFTQLIEKTLPGIQIIRPDYSQSFQGSDLQENQYWINTYLIPAIDALPSTLKRVVNLTGGTKALTVALLNSAVSWQWLEYKAEGQRLQSFTYKNNKLEVLESVNLRSASPLEVAQLYSEHVRKEKDNPITTSPNSLRCATELWEALNKQESALLELFGNKNQGFEKIWMYGFRDKAYKKDRLSMTSQAFIQQASFTPEQQKWLAAWHQLSPEGLQYDAQEISIAGNKQPREAFRRWLSGDWLEQLVVSWLKIKTSPEAVAANVKVRPDNKESSSTGERETDVLVHYKGRTTVVEVKTDLAPGQKLADVLRQISSLEGFGRTQKILFVGPQFLKQATMRNSEDVLLRAQAEGVIIAYDQTSLYAALNGKPTPLKHSAASV